MAKEILLAEFDAPSDLLKAANSFSKCGYTHFETYSPFPIHGMDAAMKLPPSRSDLSLNAASFPHGTTFNGIS